MEINLNNRKFKSMANSSNGEVGDDTVFHYYQDGQIVWAEYGGGQIIKGFLLGKINQHTLQFNYQHINHDFELMTGQCVSTIEFLKDKILLKESWQWTCRDGSKGESLLVEM